MISKDEISKIRKQFGKNENDSGSAEVQVAILTTRIKNLKPHFDSNKHDHHSKRGLLKLIGKRRSLLKYVARTKPESYGDLIKALGLRK